MTFLHVLQDNSENKARVVITKTNGQTIYGVTIDANKCMANYEVICHAFDDGKNIRISTERGITTIPHRLIDSIEIVSMGRWID